MPDPHESVHAAAVAQPILQVSGDAAPTSPRQHVPLLVHIHALLFSAGLLGLLVGAFVHVPALLVASGPMLAMSGVLIWIGSRITFAGPLGDVLRIALGRRRVITLHARAVVWLLIGALVTAWGVHGLHHPPRDEPLLRQPLAVERAP